MTPYIRWLERIQADKLGTTPAPCPHCHVKVYPLVVVHKPEIVICRSCTRFGIMIEIPGLPGKRPYPSWRKPTWTEACAIMDDAKCQDDREQVLWINCLLGQVFLAKQPENQACA